MWLHLVYFPKLIMLLLLKTTYLLDSVTSSILFKDEKGVSAIYQASFCHHKVNSKPYFLTQTLTAFLFNMVAVFIFYSLYMKDIADTVFFRPVWGL